MEASTPIRVVILYVHPILGEGLAKLLAAEPGIAACAIATGDATGISTALSERPDAVIVERRAEAALPVVRGGAWEPVLLFIDIEGATGPIGAPRPDDLERVVRAVCDLRRTQLDLVSA